MAMRVGLPSMSGGLVPIRVVDNGDDTGSLAVAGSGAGGSVVNTPAASEVHIGQVGASTAIVAPAITVTAGAYHANDNIGGVLTLPLAARVNGGGTVLTRVSVLDVAAQKAQLELLFFSANPVASTFTDNAACVIHANDEAKFIGRYTIYASDYLTVGAKSVACVANIGLAMKPAAASTSLFLAIVSPSAPTYAGVGNLQVSLAFYQD
jgi:hypothetical protein